MLGELMAARHRDLSGQPPFHHFSGRDAAKTTERARLKAIEVAGRLCH